MWNLRTGHFWEDLNELDTSNAYDEPINEEEEFSNMFLHEQK